MKVYVVLGPTASGKTNLAIKLAQKINGEIISADSMQIYKEMDIGTAKPTTEEMQGIKHHLIDMVYPNEQYSVATFKKQAIDAIYDISNRGNTPIICGGTGLYINSITYNLDFTQTKKDEGLRNKLEALTNEELFNMLKETDEQSALRIHINDKKRLVRRLEIINTQEETGNYDFDDQNSEFDFKICGLSMDRAVLYERINMRVDVMVKKGLFDEVKCLFEKYGNTQAMQAIGYKEIIENLQEDKVEIIEKIKQNSRRFAKRQVTWFKRDNRIQWYDTNNDNIISELLND